MSRSVVAVIVLAVLVASPGLATAVVDMLDDGGTGPTLDRPTDGTASDVRSAVDEHDANGSVEVTTGPQLGTVLSATEADVDTEVSRSAFESRFADVNESERARLVAARAGTLRERARSVAEDYRTATEAVGNGTIDRSTYAQRLATLNGRARAVESGVDHLRIRAAAVPDGALATAGYDPSTLEAATSDVEAASGTGPSALRERFTGRSNVSIAVTVDNGTGVTVEFEAADGRRSVERRRPGDGNTSVGVARDEALATARGELSERNWTLREVTVDENDGTYEFEFEFAGENATGVAEVQVDGSSGETVRFEERTHPGNGDGRAEGDGQNQGEGNGNGEGQGEGEGNGDGQGEGEGSGGGQGGGQEDGDGDSDGQGGDNGQDSGGGQDRDGA